MLSNDLQRHRGEFARAIRNRHFQRSHGGILFPRQGVSIAGHFDSWVNGRDHAADPNLIPTEGLNHILDVILHGATQVNPWYVAPFSANVTPLATLTGANFTANQTEFTNYSESTRVTFNEDAAAGGSLSNDTNRAEFSLTGAATIYGCGLLSTQAKSDTAGKLLACALFAAGRAVVSGDTLQVKYTIAATSS